MGITDLKELLNKQEKLHPDLKACLGKESLGVCLKHPLVFAVPYFEPYNAVYNEQYLHKKDFLQKRIAEKDWPASLFIYERPYRFQAFEAIMDKVDDDDYWQLLASLWIDSENLWQLPLSRFFNRPNPQKMMDEDEREFYDKLPDQFVVYRGHQGKNRLGYSWTLSYWKARWFAQRWNGKRQSVVRGVCSKSDIYAILLGRNEFEVAAKPSAVQNPQTVYPLQRPAYLTHLLNEAAAGYKLSKNSYHGRWHWEKVERNAIRLCKDVRKADKLVCRLFAILHDCKRQNENEDPQHGHRAANYILQMPEKLDFLKPGQLKKLVEACRWHNDGQISDDPTIGVCWDADRLDLSRVGIVPDPKLLSTDVAKGLVWRV